MSELTAEQWNERYPAGTPALLGSQGALVYAWEAFVVDNTTMNAWTMVRVRQTGLDGTALMNGAVALESVEPLATDTDRLAAGWLDPAGVEIVWAERDRAVAELKKAKLRVGEHDEPCPHDHPGGSYQSPKCVKPRGHGTHWNGAGDVWTTDTDAWKKLTAERDRAIRERDRAIAVVDALDERTGGVS